MPQYIAFLRGMNLGKRRIKMDALRAHFVDMGFDDVATFIASGNVLFTAGSRAEKKLVSQIEEHLRRALGYDVPTYLRTRAEVAGVLAFRPFPVREMESEENTIHVGFWQTAPSAADARALTAIRTKTDEFAVNGREFYWLCRIPTHESKVWSLPEMKALTLPDVTARNISMLRRLAAQFPSEKV
ncbi:MAG TPA: DUF1697 domain-containing protein [Opitutaceae bacterium]|nr:DUF1697 domain-containing protein [Opitutaceae bacterium]